MLFCEEANRIHNQPWTEAARDYQRWADIEAQTARAYLAAYMTGAPVLVFGVKACRHQKEAARLASLARQTRDEGQELDHQVDFHYDPMMRN